MARAPRRRAREIESLAALLTRLAARAEAVGPDNAVTVAEFLAVFGRRSFGPLLLAIGLFSISPATIVPGMTWLAGGLAALVAAQMTIGAERLWLPKALCARTISTKGLSGAIRRALPWARRIDAVLKPRLVFLSQPPGLALVGAVALAAGLAKFPLGFIPAAPLAPGFVIVLIGLGVTMRDGLVLLGALVAAGGGIALALRLFV